MLISASSPDHRRNHQGNLVHRLNVFFSGRLTIHVRFLSRISAFWNFTFDWWRWSGEQNEKQELMYVLIESELPTRWKKLITFFWRAAGVVNMMFWILINWLIGEWRKLCTLRDEHEILLLRAPINSKWWVRDMKFVEKELRLWWIEGWKYS